MIPWTLKNKKISIKEEERAQENYDVLISDILFDILLFCQRNVTKNENSVKN